MGGGSLQAGLFRESRICVQICFAEDSLAAERTAAQAFGKSVLSSEDKINAEKSHCVTAEAVAAALFPLMGEYFEGKSCLAGKKIRYCFVNGGNCERFEISVRKA